MSDLISRQAAIDVAFDIFPDDEYFREQFVKGIEALPSAQRWISCSERLPEACNDVLVTDGTDCAVAHWRTDAQAWNDSIHGWCDLYGLEVIAWMPLPGSWKGEEHGTSRAVLSQKPVR